MWADTGNSAEVCFTLSDATNGKADNQRCNMESTPAGLNFRGLCMYGGCYTTAGSPCSFPFRYKGRLYDTCVKLDGADEPWCSTSTDSDWNHVEGDGSNWGECNPGCPWTNCPVGYYRAYEDRTCYKVSGSHPALTAATWEEAQEACRNDGARLYEPRTINAENHVVGEDLQYFGSPGHFPYRTQTNTAIGLKVTYYKDCFCVLCYSTENEALRQDKLLFLCMI